MSATSRLRTPLEHWTSSEMLALLSASCPTRPRSRVRDLLLAKPSFAPLADVTHRQNSHHAGASLLSKLSKMRLDVREEEVSVFGATVRTSLPRADFAYTALSSSRPSQPLPKWFGPAGSSQSPRGVIFPSSNAQAEQGRRYLRSPFYLLSSSAREDFPPNTTGTPDSVVIGLAPTTFEYRQLNEAFRLLAGEEGTGRKGQVPLIVTHKARYFGDKDGKLSLGPGALYIPDSALLCSALS